MKKTMKLLSMILALTIILSAAAFAEGERKTVSIGLPLDTNVIDYEDNAFTKVLEEQMNIEIEFVLMQDISQKLPVMVSSGSELPDILIYNGISTTTAWKWIQEGIFVPLTEYWNNPEKTKHFDGILELGRAEDPAALKAKLISDVTMPDGNIYTVLGWQEYIWNSMGYRMRINTAWLEKAGLDLPTTTDEFKEMLEYFRDNDMNGNGDATDEVPLTGSYDGTNVITYLLNAFVDYNPTYNYLAVEDGVIVPSYTKEEYKEGLEWLNELYTEGLMDPLAFTQDQTQMKALINGDIEMVGAVPSGTRSIFKAEFLKDYDGNSILAPLTGPDGVRFNPYNDIVAYGCAYITSYADDVDLCWDILESMYDFEWYLRWREGVEGENFTRDPEILATYQGLFEATTGIRPMYARINNVWGKETNVTWGSVSMPFAHTHYFMIGSYAQDLMPADGVPMLSNNEIHYAGYADCRAEEVVGTLVHTDDELNALSTLASPIKTYVDEMTTAFIVGNKSFDEWDAFQAELLNMGLEEYVEIMQNAYDRKNG